MSLDESENAVRRGSAAAGDVVPVWSNFYSEGSVAYQCRALLCPEEEGGYSAHCLNLDGVISQGDTEPEAIENISDAFRETLRYYTESGKAPPWGTVAIDRPAGSIEKWIAVRM